AGAWAARTSDVGTRRAAGPRHKFGASPPDRGATKPSVHRVAPGPRIIARSRSLVRDTQSSCPGRVQRALLRERNETRDPAREARSTIFDGTALPWRSPPEKGEGRDRVRRPG